MNNFEITTVFIAVIVLSIIILIYRLCYNSYIHKRKKMINKNEIEPVLGYTDMTVNRINESKMNDSEKVRLLNNQIETYQLMIESIINDKD